MAVPNELFSRGDVYIDFPQEEMMFRFDHASGKVYRKFYWDTTEQMIAQTSSLFTESLSYGTPVTREHYNALRAQ